MYTCKCIKVCKRGVIINFKVEREREREREKERERERERERAREPNRGERLNSKV